jgi:hypothetical protein
MTTSVYPTTARKLSGGLLVLFKAFALLGPLILLVSDGLGGVLFVALGLVLSFILLLCAGLRQLFFTPLRRAGYRSLCFAGIALLWLVLLLLLLGSLSHM